MVQQEFIHNFIEKHTEQFNPVLFTRDDQKIVDCIENIILSCERDGIITIKVLKFTLITDYMEVRNRLKQYEDEILSRKSSKSKGLIDNRYEYINLKESAINLLVVKYYIAANEKKDGKVERKSEIIEVLIAVPRVVNKFYFKLNGGLYSAMFQIVDASTYNTATSRSSTKHYITLKTTFQAVRIYRNIYDIRAIDDTPVYCVTYDNNTFRKSVPIMVYIFAKFGFYAGINFMGVYGFITLSDDPTEKIYEDEYVFKAKKNDYIFIHVQKDVFNKVHVIQHIVYVLINTPAKNTKFQDIFSAKYWLEVLGGIFNSSNASEEKGLNVLESLKTIYDLNTKNEIHLPEEYKHDIFLILRWILWEYNSLRMKDNLDIRTKKLKSEEYIANMYAARFSRNMYRLSDRAKDADLKQIKKNLITQPDIIIKDMSKDPLITFRGIITDIDSYLGPKFTYKGESGIKTVPTIYKLIHYSNMGRLDGDSSSPSDPGTNGMIVPMVTLYGNNYFSDFEEPLTFEKEYASLYNTVKEATGMVEIYDVRKKILDDKSITDQQIIEAAKTEETIRNIVKTTGIPDEYGGLPLEGSGLIQYV